MAHGLPAVASFVPVINPHAPVAREFVTMRVAGQLFGILVYSVQDVLREFKVAHVPLAPKEVAGVLNLRGRVVTAINMRECMGLGTAADALVCEKPMSVVVEYENEWFSLIVDSVGEVINLSASQIEKNPANLSGRWKEVASGIYKLKNELLIILDVKKLFNF